MKRLPVESSDLVSIGYDPEARLLEIEFKENRIYQYQDVEPDVYERFMRADSYGEFFFASINKHYRYKRVTKAGGAQKASALVFATGNTRKLRYLQEACRAYGIEVEGRELPVDEIQSHDPEKIALQKAKHAYRLVGAPVVVNDAYWNILALRGFPGAYMSYMNEWFRPEDFLALLSDKQDRTIMCTDTLVYCDGKRTKTFTETYTGKIIDKPRGEGLPISQLVVLDGQRSTIAELHQQGGGAEDPTAPIWHDFAKWYSMHRRIMKL